MITVKQYKKALSNLSEPKQKLLSALYNIEPAKDKYEIAAKLDWGAQAPNIQIGMTGKIICEAVNYDPYQDLKDYNPGITEKGYFIVVHRQRFDKKDVLIGIWNQIFVQRLRIWSG